MNQQSKSKSKFDLDEVMGTLFSDKECRFSRDYPKGKSD